MDRHGIGIGLIMTFMVVFISIISAFHNPVDDSPCDDLIKRMIIYNNLSNNQKDYMYYNCNIGYANR